METSTVRISDWSCPTGLDSHGTTRKISSRKKAIRVLYSRIQNVFYHLLCFPLWIFTLAIFSGRMNLSSTGDCLFVKLSWTRKYCSHLGQMAFLTAGPIGFNKLLSSTPWSFHRSDQASLKGQASKFIPICYCLSVNESSLLFCKVSIAWPIVDRNSYCPLIRLLSHSLKQPLPLFAWTLND